MEYTRKTLVLYSTGVCNLNCRYCLIDKSPALQEIDDLLDKSYEGDYYIDFAREMFPHKEMLQEIQIWGGEPTLSLHRAYHTVDTLINEYPNLANFFMSTNFVNENWDEEFFGFLDVLKKNSDRQFYYYLQLSLDGTKNICDANRGAGVTDKFTKHFKSFVAKLNDYLEKAPNITFKCGFKPTLTGDIIVEMARDKNTVKEYYQFFESFYDIFSTAVTVSNAEMIVSVPNTAIPAKHTKKEGLAFAQLMKYCAELMSENAKEHYFKYYTDIMLYEPHSNPHYETTTCDNCSGACGVGNTMLGLLPYDKISLCTDGFVELIGSYKQYLATHENDKKVDLKAYMERECSIICDKKDYAEYEKRVLFAYNQQSTSKLATMVNIVMTLAEAGQIDEKYKNYPEAFAGARYIYASTAFCIKGNILTTGSMSIPSTGIIKLLLNGARDVIEEYMEEKSKCQKNCMC